MKKTVLILLAAGLFAGCGDKNGATVEGSVTGVPDSTKLYLARLDNAKLVLLDSVLVSGGTFRFDIPDAYPERLRICSEEPWGSFSFILEPGNIRADLHYEDKSYSFSGTPGNDLLKNYNDQIIAMQARRIAVMDRFRANPNMDEVTRDSLGGLMEALEEERTALEVGFIKEHNNSIAAAYLLSQQSTYGFTPEEVDSVLALLAPEVPANRFVDDLKARREVLVKTSAGQPAPDFTLPRIDGTPFTLSSLRGKVVLVDFWASWCGPCRNENPRLVKMYDKYRDLGFEIVGISLDDSRQRWLEAVEEDGLTWTQVSEGKLWDTKPAVDFGVVAIPHPVLIDRDGIIVGNVVRGKKLEALVAETLGVEVE